MPHPEQDKRFVAALLPTTRMGWALLAGLAVWFVNWTFTSEGGDALFGSERLKAVADVLSLVALIPFGYFGVRGARWVSRRLLWRLRRRLIVTYFLIGALPLVLTAILVGLVGYLIAVQSESNLVARQLDAYLAQSRAAAQAISREVRMGDAEQVRQELQQRADALASAFPGLTLVAIHRGEPAIQVAVKARGGPPVAAPVWPAWLDSKPEFHGLALERPSRNERRIYARHVVKLGAPVHTLLQLSYPIGDELSARLSQVTGLPVMASQVVIALNRDGTGQPQMAIEVPEPERGQRAISRSARGAPTKSGNTKSGNEEEISIEGSFNGYPIFKPMVDWQTGREVEGNALLVEKSSLNPSRIFQRVRQFSSGTMIGQSLGYVVAGLSIFFLALTSLAIISAAVLTRSITRAVHHLYRGTRRVEAGDLEHEIPPLGRDQLAELAISFNQMMRSVRELLRVSAEKQRLDQEMRIAAEVQARLFPRGTPPSQSLEIAPGICIPARSVSGDYYDFLEVAPGIIGFVVADVCGKGMSAALLMSNLQANLRGQVQAYRDLYEARGGATVTALEVLPATPGEPAQAQSALLQRHGQSPEAWTVRHSVSQVVARVNRQIEGSINDSRYVTFFYAEYEEATALLRYTNAGHNPPLLVRHDRRVERLECGGPVLGIFREAEYEEGTVKLTHGDLLVAFTDGLIEAHNAAGEEFGETRLCEVLKANLTLPPSKIEQALLQAVRDWTNGAEQEDDLTLVLLKCR